jgi:spermidine synthase
MKNGNRSSSVIFVAVSLCFFLSGFAALLYQMAWMRQLSIVFGTSELAVATILAAYMAGLALGAAIAARVMHRIRRPILVYGILEATIAISAIAVPFLLQLAGVLYAAIFGGSPHPPDASGMGQSLFYLVVTFVVLVVPTACMGATLPMVTRYAVHKDEDVGPRVGLLYSINSAGAIAGTLAAAFLLLPALGLWGTILVGAAINLAVFVVAAWLAKRVGTESSSTSGQRSTFGWRPESWILPLMLFSGFATFAYEVLWTRLLSHILGGSVVAFATMLASFLSGIAIGSAVASRFAKTRATAQLGFVLSELGIAATCIAIYLTLDQFVPPTAGLLGNVSIAIALLLPATLFIGATFPFAVRILCADESEASVASARIYAWNTVGAIAGAVVAGFVLIPMLKYKGSIKVVVAINIALAFAAAFAVPPRRVMFAIGSAAAFVLLLVGFSPGSPESLLRVSPLNDLRSGDIRYYDVGRSATVLMLERDGYLYLRTNGLSEAATDLKGAPPSKHTQRLLATLPVLARPDTKSMLIVGFGGGVVAEDLPSTLAEIDIVELEPKVLAANRSVSADRNIDPLQDSRINVVINDARNALRLTDKHYDAIVSQPSHPWTAGASHLYTHEFMSLVRSRLNSGGVFLQWMNTQFVSEPLLKSLAATLLDVFPHVRAYQFEANILFFLASESAIDPEAQMVETGEPFKSHAEEFKRKGIGSINDLVAALAWDEAGLEQLAADAPLITDNDNRMAMQSAAAFEGSALPYSRLQELIGQYGILFDAQSNIHQGMSAAIDFVYVIDRLEMIRARDLSMSLADTFAESDSPTSLLLRAKILQMQGQGPRADQLLLAALESQPENPVASYLLLKNRGDAVLDGSLPERLKPYAGNLTDVAAAVLESMEFVKRRDMSHARINDTLLARAEAHDQWYLNAAKLRADWRITAARTGESSDYAAEALAIIDEAIALRQDVDFYGMRMAAAFLADDYDAVVETARRMVWLIRQDLEFRGGASSPELSPSDRSKMLIRLESMQTGLSVVRESGHIADYKFVTLDENLSELQRNIETYAAKEQQ